MKNWSHILRNIAAQGHLTSVGLEYVTSVAGSPPSRNPRSGPQKNIIVDIASRKMGHTVAVESLTIEAGYALTLEWPSVISSAR